MNSSEVKLCTRIVELHVIYFFLYFLIFYWKFFSLKNLFRLLDFEIKIKNVKPISDVGMI